MEEISAPGLLVARNQPVQEHENEVAAYTLLSTRRFHALKSAPKSFRKLRSVRRILWRALLGCVFRERPSRSQLQLHSLCVPRRSRGARKLCRVVRERLILISSLKSCVLCGVLWLLSVPFTLSRICLYLLIQGPIVSVFPNLGPLTEFVIPQSHNSFQND
jgi:hypothetical protein